MNITEALHTQTLLGWLTDPHQTSHADTDRARQAAGYLADRANRTLSADPTGDQITTAWPDLLSACAGCERCTPTTSTEATR